MQYRRLVVASTLAALLSLSSPAGAATVTVTVLNTRFSPNDITIQAGDTVHWVNNSGSHTVTADNGTFNNGSSASSWTYDRTFNDAGEIRYYCAVHSAPGLNIAQYMNGRIVVQGAAPAPTFQINQGMAGVWYNPQTGGQGFLFEVRPSDKFMFVAWFTFDKDVPMDDPYDPCDPYDPYDPCDPYDPYPKVGSIEQRWFTIQGGYDADRTVNAKIYSTSGGIFDTVHQVTNTPVGTATITFTSCTAGSIMYNIPGFGLSGTIPIQRAIPGTESVCATLAAATPQ